MAGKINPIKALYRANFYNAKTIRPKAFPEGYFMKKSILNPELNKIGAENSPKWADRAAKLVDKLISVFS